MSDLIIFFFTLQGMATKINFVCLLIAFVSSLYVAIHSRIIPIWIRTPLWYVGVSCFLVAISIGCEWTLGPQFIFSYSRFGLIGETMINFFLAVAGLIMLLHTVRKDVSSINMRRRHDD